MHKHVFTRRLLTAATAVLLGATTLSAQAETRVTYKSASAGTAYYQMGSSFPKRYAAVPRVMSC